MCAQYVRYNKDVIYYLYGDNSFEIEQALARIVTGAVSVVERIDGNELGINDLPNIFAGQTLFSLQRTIVIRGLVDNKAAWSKLEDYIENVDADTTVVLIDTKPDKRTRTFKKLQKLASVQEFKLKNERELGQWLVGFATREFSLDIGRREASLLIDRVGPDQWALYHALEKLQAVESVTSDAIETYIDQQPRENVFLLLQSALRGDSEKVQHIIEILSITEDGFRTFGLLTSQVVMLCALSLAGDDDNVAKDFGASPFVLQKLRPFAATLTPSRRRHIIETFAEADSELKLGAEPWLVITKTLAAILPK